MKRAVEWLNSPLVNGVVLVFLVAWTLAAAYLMSLNSAEAGNGPFWALCLGNGLVAVTIALRLINGRPR